MNQILSHDIVKLITSNRRVIQEQYIIFYLSHLPDKLLKSKNLFKKIEMCEVIEDGLIIRWFIREKKTKKKKK